MTRCAARFRASPVPSQFLRSRFLEVGHKWHIQRITASRGAISSTSRRPPRLRSARAGGVAAHQSDEPFGGEPGALETEVDLSSIAPGQMITVMWRKQPVFIRRRTPEEIKAAEDVSLDQLRDPQADSARVYKPGVAGPDRHLHASGLHPARSAQEHVRRIRRLALPVPRLALRYVRAHPQRPRAAQSGRAGLYLRFRYQDRHRSGQDARRAAENKTA